MSKPKSMTTKELDDELVHLAKHAKRLRDEVAAGDVNVERAVALGVLSAATLMLESLCPQDRLKTDDEEPVGFLSRGRR